MDSSTSSILVSVCSSTVVDVGVQLAAAVIVVVA